MALRFIPLKDLGQLNDGDPVAGVCYAPAAEDVLKHVMGRTRPAVIGYLVDDEVLEAEQSPAPMDHRGECGDDCDCWAPEEVDE